MRRRPLHVVGHNAVVGVSGGRLEVRRDGSVVASAPLIGVSELVLTGYATVTTPALHRLLREAVPVVLLTANGQTRGRLEPPGSHHADYRRRQLMLSGDPSMRLDIGRNVVAAKLANQARMLSKRTASSHDPAGLRQVAASLRGAEARSQVAASLAELRGVEGAATRRYFNALRSVIAGRATTFGRRDRFGYDAVNALLNYCSALLRETVVTAVVVAGLDPTVGFLHDVHRGRPALALDLMEEWRPVLLERTVITLVTRRQVTDRDLVQTPAGPRLGKDARRAAVSRFQQRLQARYRSGSPESACSFRSMLDHQATALREVVMGNRSDYEAFRWH